MVEHANITRICNVARSNVETASIIRSGLNGLAVRIPIAAAQERFRRIKLAERTSQNFDNRVPCRHAMNEKTFVRPTGLPVCSHERLSKNVIFQGMITSAITGRRQVILHFKTHGLRRSVCIVLLSRVVCNCARVSPVLKCIQICEPPSRKSATSFLRKDAHFVYPSFGVVFNYSLYR